MPNTFGRSLTDAAFSVAAFALPASASSSTNSSGYDFGTDVHKTAKIELELTIPALTTTIVPDTKTVTVIAETSTASNFATIARTLYSKTLTGSGGAGVSASSHLFRLPSDSERYVRWKVTFGALTTDGSAVSATPRANF